MESKKFWRNILIFVHPHFHDIFFANFRNFAEWLLHKYQSYVIKSAPWTILWFRILGIFSVENIKRLCVFMFQTWDNSQLLRRVLWISAELTIVSSLKHKNTQPLYIFNRVRILHLDRLKEGTWLHSFGAILLLRIEFVQFSFFYFHVFCRWHFW